VRIFCYPYGRFDEGARQAVVNAGYDAACSTIAALNRSETDCFALRRYGINATTGPDFDIYLTGKYAWYYRFGRQLRRRR
jgi:hypothetical protein